MSETLSEVVALDMPQRVLSEIKNVACIKTVQKTSKGGDHLGDVVAGGPRRRGLSDDEGNGEGGPLVRRSTLDLLNYGSHPETERIGLFGRKREARRKTLVTDGN